MLPKDLIQQMESILGDGIISQVPVAGGDTSQSYCVKSFGGQKYFVKVNRCPESFEMFKSEVLGLAILGFSKVIRVPKVVWRTEKASDVACLILEYIPRGRTSAIFWERLGQGLANLHGNTSSTFGFSHNNFIGTIRQNNKRHESWSAFYANERLTPQMKMAIDNGRMQGSDSKRLERLCARLDTICPNEVPALIHGDFWSGNVLCSEEGEPVLVDPSAYFGHREMDLAMAQLFGRFDDSFFQSYNHQWPLEPGFNTRSPVYQLYYVLIHVNLFGLAYTEQARTILRQYA